MSKRAKDESSFTDEIGEFLYYACCCFMCPCRVTSPCSKCCDCCPCCWYTKHYERLERENEELLLPREPGDYGSGNLHPSPYKVEVISKQPRSKPSPEEDGSQDDLPPDHDRAALLKSAGSGGQQSTPPKTENDVLAESSESKRLHFTDEDEEHEIDTEKEEVKEDTDTGREEVKEEADTGREEVKEEADTGVSATLSWGDFGEEEEDEDSEMATVSGQKGTSDSQRVLDEGKDPIESVKVKGTPPSDGIEEGKSPSRVILSIAPTPTKESQDDDSYSSSEEYFAPAVSTKKNSQQEEEEEFIDDRSVLFEWRSAGRKVAVTGDFNEWTEAPMKKSSDGVFRYQTKLKVGRYLYRFKVDKKWTVDDERPIISKGEGRDNTFNVVDVK